MALPSNEKVWIGGGVVAAVLVAAMAWMLLIGPERSSASSLREQTVSAQDQNNILRSKLAKLRKDNANLPKLAAKFKDVRAGLPTAGAMTTFTRQLTAEATEHHLSLGAITLGGPKSAGVGGTTTSTATGLEAIPVTLTVAGSADNLQSFLSEVQYSGARRVLISSIQLAPSSSSGVASINAAASATIQLSVFSAPLSAAQDAQLQKQLSKAVGSG